MMHIGYLLIFSYNFFTALQGVYFSSFLQTNNLFLTIGLNFLIANIIFIAILQFKGYSLYATLKQIGLKATIILNLFSIIAWGSYFIALKYIQPSVESAIATVCPPVTTYVILYLNKQIKFDKNKLLILITLTVGSALLLYSALNNTSIKSYNSLQTLLGLTMATLCGLALTFYIIYSKKLTEEKQISAYQIMSVRFVALIILSLIFTPDLTTNIQNITLLQAGIFIAISIIGSVLPLLCLQLGFKYLKAIDISLTMSWLPLFFYILETFDSRIHFSIYSLLGILIVVIALSYNIIVNYNN